MNNSSKILKIVFVVLLIITSAELFYFFIYQPSTINKKSTNLSPTINQNKTTLFDKQTNSFAVNRGQIEYLSTLKKIDIDQLKIFSSIGGIGTVANIKKLTDKQISFDLTDENNKKSTNIKFPIVENIPVHIYQSNNDVITKANLEDLIEGDKIKFLWIYDLTKQSGKESVYDNELVIYKNSNEKIY